MQDRQNMFSINQLITTGTQVSTDKVNLRGGTPAFITDQLGNTIQNDPGRSPALDVLVQVVADFASGTSLAVNLVADDDPALGSPTILQSSGAIAEAALKKGYQFRLAVPPGIPPADIFMGLQFVTVGTHTVGAITAGLVQRGAKPTAPGVFL